jgi:steroid 5-alpha reductase family enzyme
MITLFFQASLIILVLLILLWVVSVFIKNVSIVDLFWGFGFVVINTFYVLSSSEVTARQLLVLVLVSVWGLRLSVYLAWRNIGKAEDFRYQEFRRKYGPERYWWFSFFQTFLLQGVLMMLISTPLLGANFGEQNSRLQWLDYAGILVWIIGFSFEAGGDFQLARFKSNPQNKGKVLNTGFWKYTRHPNYFGDSAVWWSYALFCIAAGSYWLSLGSVLMTLLIIKVSGVALLEKSLTNTKPQYSEYIRKTNAFIPWFPKK